MTSSLQEFFIDISGARLFCRRFGTGQPLLVLHGGPGFGQEYLLPGMAALAANHSVIFYDQRAAGNSTGDITPESMAMTQFLADLEAVRQSLHLDKVSLLGHSWGALVAMHYALAHPERLNHLILVSAMPASSEEYALFVKEWVRRTAPYRAQLDALKKNDLFLKGHPDTVADYYRIMLRTYCHRPESADALHLLMTPQAARNSFLISEQVRHHLCRQPYNFHEDLQRLDIQSLVVHGEADPIPLLVAERLHRSLRRSNYARLQECGHFPYVEQPKVFVQAIEVFLSSKR